MLSFNQLSLDAFLPPHEIAFALYYRSFRQFLVSVADASLQSKIVTALLAGVLSHLLFFIRGEWHLHAPRLLVAAVLLPTLFFLNEVLAASDKEVGDALQVTAVVATSYHVSVFSSIIIYRLFFHPLRNFPGPILARVTKIWHMLMCLDGQNHLFMERMNEQYGEFVRTGPNEITVFSADAFSAIGGTGSPATKSAWYDFLLPEIGLVTIRDTAYHDKRRKIWVKAFTPKSLTQYEHHAAEFAFQLEKLIAKRTDGGLPVEVSKIFYWFSFDVMGEFTMSYSFNMLQTQEWHYAIGMLRSAMRALGPLTPVPWLAQLGFAFAGRFWVVKDFNVMREWCKEQMSVRMQMVPKQEDVASHIIKASERENRLEADRNVIDGDAISMMVAGSDTVAPSLVLIFYRLSIHKEYQDKLYQEVKDVDVRDAKLLQRLPYLNAFINEVLRFHPVVPSGGLRDTPPEGMTVAGEYIPGDVTIAAPRYTIARQERYFEDAKTFQPERWHSKPEMIKDKRAFSPFSQGRYLCIGQPIALSELRLVTALLMSKYTVEFAPGETGWRVEAEMRDQFTTTPGDLHLTFSRRQQSAF